jgi:hypothetical protein
MEVKKLKNPTCPDGITLTHYDIYGKGNSISSITWVLVEYSTTLFDEPVTVKYIIDTRLKPAPDGASIRLANSAFIVSPGIGIAGEIVHGPGRKTKLTTLIPQKDNSIVGSYIVATDSPLPQTPSETLKRILSTTSHDFKPSDWARWIFRINSDYTLTLEIDKESERAFRERQLEVKASKKNDGRQIQSFN